jgi:predicted ArsR family transcriptional regulator
VQLAQQLLQDIDESNNNQINNEFKKKVDQHLMETTTEFLITLPSTEKSIMTIKYFLQQKQFLASYSKDGNESTCEFGNINESLIRKILLWPGNTVKCQDVASCSRNNSDTIKQHMKQLEEVMLGKVNMDKPLGGGRVTVVFIKTDVNDLDIDSAMQFTEKPLRFGVKFED